MDPVNIASAVSEAVSNAVTHAYRFGLAPGEVRVNAVHTGDRLTVVVEDDGVGMRPNLESEGMGVGSTLMAAMALEVHYETPERGVRVTMKFPCREPAAA